MHAHANQSLSIFAVSGTDGVEDVTKEPFFPFHLLKRTMPKRCICNMPDLLVFCHKLEMLIKFYQVIQVKARISYNCICTRIILI